MGAVAVYGGRYRHATDRLAYPGGCDASRLDAVTIAAPMRTARPGSQAPVSSTVAPGVFANRPRALLIGVLVGLATAALYSRMLWSDVDFVSLDDPQYVRENSLVRSPSWHSAATFFREVWRPSTVEGYYQPLTMVSLMLDAWVCECLATQNAARVFHLHSILLHVVNAILVFVLLRRVGIGLAVAGWLSLLFGVHPIQVESVAWISQRKTVLASLFGLLSLLAYLRLGVAPTAGRRVTVYIVSGALFVLAVMAKPTVMLLPLVFVLLDYWPLRRLSWKGVIEKTPLLALMLLAAYVAARSQAETSLFSAPQTTQTADALALMARNVTSLAGRLIAPLQLAPVYPVENLLTFNAARTLVDFLLIAGVLLLAWWLRRRMPAVAVAVLGFLVLVSPALGQVRFSEGLTGDRFAYLPMALLLIPLGLVLQSDRPTRHVPEGVSRGSAQRGTSDTAPQSALPTGRGTSRFLHVAGMGFAVVFAVASTTQMLIWRDGYTLFSYMLSLHPESVTDRVALADWYTTNGRAAEAIPLLEYAVERQPHAGEVRYFYGNALGALRRIDEAVEQYEAAVRVDARKQVYQQALGGALLLTGQYEKARQAFVAALQCGPESAALHTGHGRALLHLDKPVEARLAFAAAQRDQPYDAELNFLAACACAALNDSLSAARYLSIAVQQDSNMSVRAARDQRLARWADDPAFRGLIAR